MNWCLTMWYRLQILDVWWWQWEVLSFGNGHIFWTLSMRVPRKTKHCVSKLMRCPSKYRCPSYPLHVWLLLPLFATQTTMSIKAMFATENRTCSMSDLLESWTNWLLSCSTSSTLSLQKVLGKNCGPHHVAMPLTFCEALQRCSWFLFT